MRPWPKLWPMWLSVAKTHPYLRSLDCVAKTLPFLRSLDCVAKTHPYLRSLDCAPKLRFVIRLIDQVDTKEAIRFIVRTWLLRCLNSMVVRKDLALVCACGLSQGPAHSVPTVAHPARRTRASLRALLIILPAAQPLQPRRSKRCPLRRPPPSRSRRPQSRRRRCRAPRFQRQSLLLRKIFWPALSRHASPTLNRCVLLSSLHWKLASRLLLVTWWIPSIQGRSTPIGLQWNTAHSWMRTDVLPLPFPRNTVTTPMLLPSTRIWKLVSNSWEKFPRGKALLSTQPSSTSRILMPFLLLVSIWTNTIRSSSLWVKKPSKTVISLSVKCFDPLAWTNR